MAFTERGIQLASRVWRAMPVGLRRTFLHSTNDRFLVGVIGIIRDERDRVLVLEHRFRTPNAWGLPGGYIDHGETLGEGLVREIQEEVGLEIAIEDAPAFDTELYVPGHYISVTLLARAKGEKLTFSSEILSGGFFSEDELPEGTYTYHVELLRRFWASLRDPGKAI
jgi:ADP-ribose pyrophosphatase YjhB (NUDIX family)